jgi:type IV pilus assembly protein PilE
LFRAGAFRSIAAVTEEKTMPRAPFTPDPAWRRCHANQAGFTLIELMIAVVVLAILTTIAYPTYNEFIMRSRITEATSGMNDFRTRMEQYFQDNRTYANAGACGLADPAFVPGESSFQILCSAASATGYQLDANGNAAKGMSLFRYRMLVSPAGVVRSSTITQPGWSASANCWTVRKNGKCS